MTIQNDTLQEQQTALAHIVKDACIRAALEGYESAAMSGLCCEGAWEAAISAMRMLDLDSVIKEGLTG